MRERIRHYLFGHQFYWHSCQKKNGKVTSFAHWECSCGKKMMDAWQHEVNERVGILEEEMDMIRGFLNV